MHNAEPARAARERYVQCPQALHFVGHDGGRLDHDDTIEFEALDHTDRNNRDTSIESCARGPAVLDAGSVECRRDHLDHWIGRNDCDVAVDNFAHEASRLGGHSGAKCIGRIDMHEVGHVVALTHRCWRTQRRRCGHHHPVSDLHDLCRNSVAHAEADDPAALAIGQVFDDVVPAVGGKRSGGLGNIADNGH